MKTDEILVIPDVHGRRFWKEGNPNVYTKDYKLIVFLGDYLDPYYDENINFTDCLQNFKEIIQFKKENIDRVVLLLGNHDLHYVTHIIQSGRKYGGAPEIPKLFEDNWALFKVMHTISIFNQDIVFSHAPIIKKWIEYCNVLLEDVGQGRYMLPTEVYELANFLNYLWIDYNTVGNPRLFGLLSYCSWYRGGCDGAGSPIWADVREAHKIENWYQVFGHTQLIRDECLKGDGWVDTDCRRCFPLNELL